MPEPLPIDALLPRIVSALTAGAALVVQAPTGAGKTTRVAPALVGAGLGPALLIEPRRVAARAAAARMAAERDEQVGASVGYQVRFDRRAGRDTTLLVATPGIVLRMLQDDPALERFGVVLFDEFHERGLESDLALGMCRLVQQTVRPDLRLVAMSATLETARVAEYLGGCPIVASEGRLFPVAIRYEAPPPRAPIADATAEAIERTFASEGGDLLAFLPGMGEIRQTADRLGPWARKWGVTLAPLHGDLPAEEQDAALRAQSRPRVVLATNVAETSVTVEGIVAVVDSGWARQMEYDASVGLDRLRLAPISRASADQRAGRAGRVRPGVCVRLWNELDHRARPERTEPEIRRVDLAGAALQLLALGEADVERFPWMEAPRPAALRQARDLLERLGATADGRLVDLGRRMARIPAPPRLARMLVEGARLGAAARTALAAAILAERDPFLRDDAFRGPTTSDLLDRVHALERFDAGERGAVANVAGARFVLQARDQLVRSVGATGDTGDADAALTQALLAAFPDRLARRREPGSRRGVLVGGRGVRLGPRSGVAQGELFLCLDVDAGDEEATVRMAAAVPRDEIPSERLDVRTEVRFDADADAERVVASKSLRFADLVIEETPAHLPPGERVAQTLLDAARARLERTLPVPDSASGVFLTRARWLAAAMPDLGLPTFGDDDLGAALESLVLGRRSFAELRQADWASALASRLTARQRQALEREAPARWTAPTGSSLEIVYALGKTPSVAVRIQELFGLREGPRLAGGRVRVLLHLLAPNFRPQQITDDLAGFWANTYQQVRKDLRARYPKHAWPEDPLAEPPLRGPKRRT